MDNPKTKAIRGESIIIETNTLKANICHKRQSDLILRCQYVI
jgi:hypothetical protein